MFRETIEETLNHNVDRLVFNTAILEEETTLSEAGLQAEANIEAFVALDAGKRKRKKKVYTKPKRIAHKHKPRPKAILEYFSVEASGKVRKLKQECESCPVGKYINTRHLRTDIL